MSCGTRADRQHLTLSLHCPATSPATARSVLADALCGRAARVLPWKIHALPSTRRILCRSSTTEKEFGVYPNICFFGEAGYKSSYMRKGKMGESEKIAMFSKRKLFVLLFQCLCLNCTVIFYCWKVALLHTQTLPQCQPGLEAWSGGRWPGRKSVISSVVHSHQIRSHFVLTLGVAVRHAETHSVE